MREDDFINMIVNSFNSEFRTVDVHAYARKNGFIPIDIFAALNEAKDLGLIELKDNDFNTIRLTPFGERVKDVGGWFEYKFLDKSEQKKIKKPKKPKKPKQVIEVPQSITTVNYHAPVAQAFHDSTVQNNTQNNTMQAATSKNEPKSIWQSFSKIIGNGLVVKILWALAALVAGYFGYTLLG